MLNDSIQRPVTGHYQLEKNKKVTGMMKVELDENAITKFVAVMAKMYAYRKIDKKLKVSAVKDKKVCSH